MALEERKDSKKSQFDDIPIIWVIGKVSDTYNLSNCLRLFFRISIIDDKL